MLPKRLRAGTGRRIPERAINSVSLNEEARNPNSKKSNLDLISLKKHVFESYRGTVYVFPLS